MISGKDFAAQYGMGNLDNNTEASLRERIKELTCLYGITQHIMKEHESTDEIFQGIVEHITPAWQYPEITVGQIVIDDHIYTTSDFKKAHDKQTSDIIVNGVKKGAVEVIYTKKMPRDAEGPFLKEERSLIDVIAKQVALVIERLNAEKEKKELEKQLIHTDRLATIGQLAAGVAHELNEPLGNILGFAQLVKKNPELPRQAEYDLEKIETASLYAREVVKKLLIFSRQTPTKKAKIKLNKVVNESLSLFEGRLEKEGIELKKSLSPELPEITADAGQINQVLVNLTVNAIQAMPKGGTLTVRTEAMDEHVLIYIEDTGMGMSDEVIEQVFLPFFTTKDIDQGTGIGLAVVHGIITSHGGSIDVISRENIGTCFQIKLPIIAENKNRDGLIK